MANQNAPFGLSAISRTGSAYVGGVNTYYIPASNYQIMSVGDPVVSGGSADADGVPSIARAEAGDAVRGIIVGFVFDRATENLPSYRAASTLAYAIVADDPSARVVIQENGAISATDVGSNVNFVMAPADPVTGKSQVQLNSSSVGTGATLPLKVLELYQAADNEIGTNAVWVCSFNTHELKGDTGSTGV